MQHSTQFVKNLREVLKTLDLNTFIALVVDFYLRKSASKLNIFENDLRVAFGKEWNKYIIIYSD